jgi:hypothetical protein
MFRRAVCSLRLAAPLRLPLRLSGAGLRLSASAAVSAVAAPSPLSVMAPLALRVTVPSSTAVLNRSFFSAVSTSSSSSAMPSPAPAPSSTSASAPGKRKAKRYCVALDGSAHSLHALDVARDLLRSDVGDHLFLFTVPPPVDIDAALGPDVRTRFPLSLCCMCAAF